MAFGFRIRLRTPLSVEKVVTIVTNIIIVIVPFRHHHYHRQHCIIVLFPGYVLYDQLCCCINIVLFLMRYLFLWN